VNSCQSKIQYYRNQVLKIEIKKSLELWYDMIFIQRLVRFYPRALAWDYTTCWVKFISRLFTNMGFVCLFVLSHTSNFQLYGDCHHYRWQDCKLDLHVCLALTAFSSEGSFTWYTYCDTRPPFLRSYPKDPWFSLLNAMLLPKKQSLSSLKA
jgi:hypothetical protein